MREVFICDAARTAIGRYGGALAKVRTDDLAAVPSRRWWRATPRPTGRGSTKCSSAVPTSRAKTIATSPAWRCCLPGCRRTIPGVTINRLCASGLNAVGDAARAIRAGEMEFAIAGGVESMTRAPFVMGKADEAFSRQAEIYDTTLGWRFINPLLKAHYGVDSMAETGENVAEEFQVARNEQDAFALRSQQRAAKAQAAGYFAEEIVPVQAPGGKAGPITVDKDEHPRPDTTLENLAKLKPIVRNPGTITAGNASGLNDGAAALILASEEAVKAHGLTPRARILGMASAGVPPRIMGIGPVPSTRKLMERLGLKISDFDLIELNEAFASQGSRCCASSACRTMPSTSIRTAAPSRSAIRSACRAPAWRSLRRMVWRSATANARSPPCASASARACRWRWSGCAKPFLIRRSAVAAAPGFGRGCMAALYRADID